MKKNIKILSTNFEIALGDVRKNLETIKNIISKAESDGVNILSLPELSLTGASLYDLYKEDSLIKAVEEAIVELKNYSKDFDLLISVGAPLRSSGLVYNTSFLIKKGEILNIYVKTNLKDYEKTVFSDMIPESFLIGGENIEINPFYPENIGGLKIGVSIGEDEKSIIPQSLTFKELGADIILNPNAFEKTVLSTEKTINDIKFLSKDVVYISTGTGIGESSTDFVYQGLNVIIDDGKIQEVSNNDSVVFNKLFEIDIDSQITFTNFSDKNIKLDKFPYIPRKEKEDLFVKDVFDIASAGLLTRMGKIGVKDVFIGVSGGLDSTMALLFIDYAFKKAGFGRENIHAYTMPAFATSKRTKSNANLLCEALDIKLNEINISEAVRVHLKDIGHDGIKQDVAYENAQARERTQVLFDLANMHEGIVIGTGDLSEIMQGFATFNGDHMSNYSLNASLTKTHLRFIVGNVSKNTENDKLKAVLEDILATPISPELKNESEETISQKTEDIIGPYELIDFFIYYHLAYKLSPEDIYKKAVFAFEGDYSKDTIKKWLKSYYKRYASSQFKRATAVDGPSITGLSTSPRLGYKIPSDMSANIYLGEIDED